MKKIISLNTLLSLFFVFVTIPFAVSQMGDIAIFTEQVSWTDVATANAAAQKIQNELKITKNVEILGDNAIGNFAEEKTGDGKLDIIITFGWFPTSLYPAGNAKEDGSIGELFLEDGNMFINTADYIFYVSNPNNGDTGLKNMTDSTFDMWTDGTTTKPTEEGEKYTPSVVSFGAGRCFRGDQIDANEEWEIEAAFGSSGEVYVDPGVIHNVENDGRVAIVFQAGGTLPRAEVMIEMLDNWLSERVEVEAVEPSDKLSTTWGEIKKSF